MKNPISTQTLIAEIHEKWRDIIAPKADPQRWDKALREALKKHTVYNWTDDFTYSKCHSYEILLQKIPLPRPESLEAEQRLIRMMEGEKYSVLLKLSVVAPYYAVFLLRRTLGPHAEIVESVVSPQTPSQIDLLQRVRNFAVGNGYTELEGTYLSEPVPGVALELAGEGKVLIYNCLFEDQDNEAAK